MKLVHFINLLSATDDCWNEAKEAPEPLQGRTVTVAIDGELEAVLLASPDAESGRAIPLEYTILTTPRGRAAVIKLPVLLYWDVLIIKM